VSEWHESKIDQGGVSMNNQNTGNMELSESNRKTIYKIGGIAALLTVVVAFGEMVITFLPGGYAPVETVFDWFTQLQGNWFMGLLATNRAFAMLELSGQYVQATTEAQRSILAAAGQAMLSVGRSHSPGTFIGFFLGELAGILMSVVMQRGKIFNKATALIGIIAFTLLSIFEVCTSFIPGLREVAMIIAISGGLLNVIWLILLGRRFFQLVHMDE
jgi:uncharacterized membrane protein